MEAGGKDTYNDKYNAIMEADGKDRAPMLVAGQQEESKFETYSTINNEIKKKIDVEAEAVHIILTMIDNDIYSTVDACTMQKRRGLQLNSPLASVVSTQQQPVYYPQPKPYYTPPTSSTQSQTTTRSKGKEIARASSPPLESEHKVITDEDETPQDKDIAKLMALISTSFKKVYKPTNNNFKTSSYTRNNNVDNTLINDRRSGYDRQTEWAQGNAGQQKGFRILPTTRKDVV
nr:hypothetical protein [Tanacetum cinerariifolium]